MQKGRRPGTRRFEKMDTKELAEATTSYRREMVIEKFGPLKGAAGERWKRARRKRVVRGVEREQ